MEHLMEFVVACLIVGAGIALIVRFASNDFLRAKKRHEDRE